MTGSHWYWALLLVMLALSTRLRIVPDHERFAHIVVGRFVGFKGPGIVFTWKGAAELKKVQTGERGVVVNDMTVRLAAGDLPALIDGNPKVGAFVRVTGFEPKRVLTAVDFDQSRVFKCEKCGHDNRLQPSTWGV